MSETQPLKLYYNAELAQVLGAKIQGYYPPSEETHHSPDHHSPLLSWRPLPGNPGEWESAGRETLQLNVLSTLYFTIS